jgi:enamine deaminase RidA (YjgF/YER057c/UK114 family)
MPPKKRSSTKAATVPVLPVTQPGGMRYAPGMRAGHWLFATGHKGTPDFKGAMAPEVLDAAAPLHGLPKNKKEALRLFDCFERILKAGGSDPKHVVRVDQYYRHGQVVPAYHEVRRAFFGGHVPPSTSNLHQDFLARGQDMEVQLLAVASDAGSTPVQHRPKDLPVHASSSYSPVLVCGDYVFVAGQTAEALDPAQGPIDPEARLLPGHLWKGTPIKLETEFILKRKLIPALSAVGCSLRDVVKAQVYLRDIDDAAKFNEVWAAHFGANPPATTIITTSNPGFVCEVGRIEINTISVKPGGAAKKEVIDAGVPMPYAGQAQAIRAGDLLFLGGMMAVTEKGSLPPKLKSVGAQMDYILDHAEKICRKAGMSLANVVRVQQFHTDLRTFKESWKAWDKRLPGQYLPYSAIETPALAVPGAVVLLDLWVYAP